MLLEKQYVYEKFLEYTYYVFLIFCHTLFVIYYNNGGFPY